MPPRCVAADQPWPPRDICRTRPPRAALEYAVLATPAILRFPPPPLADQAVLYLRRWRRCSRTRSTSRGPGRGAASRDAVAAGRNYARNCGDLVQVVADASTAAPPASAVPSAHMKHNWIIA